MPEDLRFPSSGTAPYMKVLKGELPIQTWSFAKSYKKYFDKGSIRPVLHVCMFMGILGYTLDFNRHLKHNRHAALEKHLDDH
eukprot:CAMPEP_0183331118 /NCGR_PEP_ID=MMETSP0164_2-20130417/522_1 /TAXON_ID=221442 /ORGANISM="Coccolithus pelagicus ssp braarudi, Strain PLY182g" /LENGTH=81 /DNA_ID=CAMNT_0025499497 /DNA_START=22 /DNA_END=267 /DNA_ORIENTATION=+